VETAWKLGLIALVALVLTLLPGGGNALDVVLTVLSIAFFTAIAVLGYRLFRQFRMDLEGLPDGDRAVLYGSVGLAFLTFCATDRLFDVGGGGAVIWLALLGACSFGIYRVWTRYRAYE
jgi:TRAP-type C4-dicarboxylate transport system permease small subunit